VRPQLATPPAIDRNETPEAALPESVVTFAADPGSELPELDSALSQNPGMHEPPVADPASSPEHGEVAAEPSLVLGLAPQLATGFSGDIQL